MRLKTEQSNELTKELDALETIEIIKLMSEADQEAVLRVREEAASIAAAVEIVSKHIRQGGRLIYVGAGTSGRLGVLDAAECPPTFGVSRDVVLGRIAGGREAMFASREGAEDDRLQGAEDLRSEGLSEKDVVVAISASGGAPYCIGALEYAASQGASTIALSCNKDSDISKYAQTVIEVDTGPEVLTGSTRLKAGTATKIVLNMISTASMIAADKVYKNHMVSMVPSNRKLKQRAKRIVMEAAGVPEVEAEALLEATKGDMKLSIVMAITGASLEQAREWLRESGGNVRRALLSVSSPHKLV